MAKREKHQPAIRKVGGALLVINRLDGQVVKASAPKAEGPELESRLRRDFSRSSHTSGHPARRLAL